MTGHPEAVLARELALCYIPACLVTDLDAGVEEGAGVTHEEVMRVFAQNVDRLRDLVGDIVAALPTERDCPCPHTFDGLKLPHRPAMRALLSRHRRLLAAAIRGRRRGVALAAAHPHARAASPRDLPPVKAARDLPRAARRSWGPPGRDRRGSCPAACGDPAGSRAAGPPAGRLSGPVRRGEPLTDARLRSGACWTLPIGRAVAAPVRLADAAVARLLHAGDRVDVLAARADAPLPARTVASAVPVLAVPRPGPDTDEGALIVVQTTATKPPPWPAPRSTPACPSPSSANEKDEARR